MAIQSSPRAGFGPRFGLEVAGLVGALAVGVGIGAMVFEGGSEASSTSVSEAPAVSPPRAASAPGVGELSDAALIASARAIHDSLIEGTLGMRAADPPSEGSVLEPANAEGLPPFADSGRVPVQVPDGFNVDQARAEHDNLLPPGGN